MVARQLEQPGGRRAERFVPADDLPAGIRVTLGLRSLERGEQSFRMVDELGRHLAFDAECLAGRVRRIRLQRPQHPVLDTGHGSAPRDAERAERRDAIVGFLHLPVRQ